MTKPSIGDRVTHLSCPDKAGIVTAICIRSYGTSYAVVWSDLTERWHAEDELKSDDENKKKMGLLS